MAAALTDLVTLAELRLYLDMKVGKFLQDDDLLQAQITGVSDQILKYLSRQIVVKQRITRLDVGSLQSKFVMPAAPIHDLTEIKYDLDRDFSNTSALESSDYEWEEEGRRKVGLVLLDRIRLRQGVGALQVTYVGGYAFDRDYYISRLDDPSTLTPSAGDIHLVGGNPIGDFSGQKDKIATRDITNTSWTFQTAFEVLRLTRSQLHLATLTQCGYLWRTKNFQGTQQVTFRQASAMTRSIGLIHPVRDMIRPLQNKMTSVM